MDASTRPTCYRDYVRRCRYRYNLSLGTYRESRDSRYILVPVLDVCVATSRSTCVWYVCLLVGRNTYAHTEILDEKDFSGDRHKCDRRLGEETNRG